MSLDVYLRSVKPCPHCGVAIVSDGSFFERNITHNLNTMAAEAGIYEACWRPDENGFETAAQVAEQLRPGLARLRSDPDHFRRFNASNGWGSYEGLVSFVEDYLAACEENPTARVGVSR